MIDEKMLIEAVNRGDEMNFKNDLHDFTPEGVGTFLQEYTNNMKRCFINLINAQPKDDGGWIPVTERKPENFISVLGYMTDAGPYPAVRECYSVGNAFFFPALLDVHPVSHWMPLPEPPKAGGGE